jgi:signal transduction histidine kinase
VDEIMPAVKHKQLWRYLRPFVAPLLLLAVALVLWEPLTWWLFGEERFNQHALKEWIQEAKVTRRLPELVGEYLDLDERGRQAAQESEREYLKQQKEQKRQQIEVHLRALGEPITKGMPNQLPLFLRVYQLKVYFDPALGLEPIVWDSEFPRQTKQYRELPKDIRVDSRGAYVAMQYQMHVYASQQLQERTDATRRLRLSGLAVVAILALLLWVFVSQRRERQRQRRELLAQQKINEADRLRLEEELRRQEAERRREEAERVSLELKSQLFANIGIMAGSYAHNIKNLLVRPNDLLSRCLENDGLSSEQGHMLHEVRQTLGTVTERLQQILQTVRRDPSQARREPIDLNDLAREMRDTWGELAREKWKLTLTLELAPEPLVIAGDHSHLQQAVENLLFNARDATFEMRSHLREQARARAAAGPPSEPERRQGLIAAAAWRGTVTLRTRRAGDRAVLEVQDNGIGMTEEVRRRCREAHFSTKRDNALYAGLSAGMGLGLSFVAVILDHHGAELEVESQPLCGTTFRARFLLATALAADPAAG